jgi:hypothetical protein
MTGPITAAMPNATTIVIAANKIFVFMAAVFVRTMLFKNYNYKLPYPSIFSYPLVSGRRNMRLSDMLQRLVQSQSDPEQIYILRRLVDKPF